MKDVSNDAAEVVTRQVHSGSRDGEPTRVAVARRVYGTDREDLWDALTNQQRLPRWFLPISGTLEVGGRYQLEGNAGGVIERCEPPEALAVTWEYGPMTSWLEVTLAPTEGGTLLELTHEAPIDQDMWDQFGPGAVGVGWDLGLLGLGLHLASGDAVDPGEALAFPTTREGMAFVEAAATSWSDAAVADGDDPDRARRAAINTIGFYTGTEHPEPEGQGG